MASPISLPWARGIIFSNRLGGKPMVCQHPGHVAPPTNAPGPLGCFKRCHCIGVLAALPDCLVCMVPLGLGLQPVSSFTTKRQLVGGLACQTGHNGALCAVAAIGCWHLACVGGAHRHLHCGLQPKTAGQAPHQAHPHFPAFSKKGRVFLGLAGHNSKNALGGGGIFFGGSAHAKAGALACKTVLLYNHTKYAFWPILAKKGHFRAAAAGPRGHMGQPSFANPNWCLGGQHGAKGGPGNGAFTFACKTLHI